jgi:two-component system, NarL family, nitrate/nitrite response regulator NarL
VSGAGSTTTSSHGHLQGASLAVKTVFATRTSILRAGLEGLLSGQGFVISGATAGVPPTLVIVEASPSTSETLVSITRAREHYPTARIAVLAESFDLSTVVAARESGADGFCSTSSAPDVLVNLLKLVALGELVIPSAMLQSLLVQASAHQEGQRQASNAGPKVLDDRVNKLSPREADVLRGIMNGAPNKVIARQFDVSEATVKVHVKAILRKIGAANRTQAALWASDRMTVTPRAYADS